MVLVLVITLRYILFLRYLFKFPLIIIVQCVQNCEALCSSLHLNTSWSFWQGLASPVVPHPSRSPGGLPEAQSNSVTIGVADEHIGAVVGRGGRNITEISQVKEND